MTTYLGKGDTIMKRILGIALALALLLTGSALAVELTDVPGTPTQDVAASLTAAWRDEAKTVYDLQVLPSDQLTMDQVTDAYTFVYEENHRPVRWYPEETQRAIEAMIGSTNPDALYMTEFMRLYAAQIEPPTDLDVVMELKVDYQPGQLTVVVLGDVTNPQAIVWTPVESHVTAVGRLEFVIPQDLMRELQGKDVLFTLLTVRTGDGGTTVPAATEKPETVPSKQAGDNTRIVRTTDKDGNVLADPFELVIVPETDLIKQELARLSEHLKTKNLPALEWLPEESQSEIRFLLGDQADKLLILDYVPLITRSYRHTDGDAITTFSFATPYKEGQAVVTALGLPKADALADGETLMDWAVQRAVVRADGTVDIVFDQLALIGMDTETGLLLVYGEPLAQ